MRIRLSTIISLVLIIGGASIVGRVVKVISLKNSDPQNEEFIYQMVEDTIKDDNIKHNFDILNDLSDHLIWFIQVTDLHFSIFQDKERIDNFASFVNETIDIIQPAVVLASGDLTDAKTIDSIGSKQYLEEWQIYNNILLKHNVINKTVWLDIRGNHDNFNVPSLSSHNNFYQEYSIQGHTHPRSYMHTFKKGYDTVAFIGVDACLLPGPRRPFNFIGVLTAKEMTALQALKEKSMKFNHTIWFGHYPTSCIISPLPGIRKLMENGLAYLCGHLHTLGGLVHNLYTRQQTGSLELELGDWKDSRLFRVAAIDHGLFSFIDIPFGEWPIILITNPKDAMFLMTLKEPLHLMRLSTHVRVLVWSLNPIVSVKMKISERSSWVSMTQVEGPLYVASWNPSVFLKGIYSIEVSAEDMKGRKKIISQSFSLDGSQSDFKFWSRAILMSNISFVFQFLFGISICLCIIPLCSIRWMHHLVEEKKILKPRLHFWLAKLWLRKLWILCCIDRLFWSIVLSSLYMPIGPWFIGEVLEGHIGVVFAWGTFVYKSYLPGSLTYAYGFLQAVMFQCPLILLTAHSADLRFQSICLAKSPSLSQKICLHSTFSFLLVAQAFHAYFFWLAYGTMALVFGPLRTWSVFLGICMWYQSTTLQEKNLRAAAKIWSVKDLSIISNVHGDVHGATTTGESTSNIIIIKREEESIVAQKDLVTRATQL